MRRHRAADERQERRVVTLLFADLAGSTGLGERLDPEDVRDLQGDLFDLVNAEVERFGGTTEKFVAGAPTSGVSLVSMFSRPIALRPARPVTRPPARIGTSWLLALRPILRLKNITGASVDIHGGELIMA